MTRRRYFSIACTDRTGDAAVRLRAEHMQAHTDYLMANLDRIIWAGARQEAGEMIGSFYLIVAPDRAAAQGFVDGDPLCKAGLFETVEVSDVRRGIFQPVLALGAEPSQ